MIAKRVPAKLDVEGSAPFVNWAVAALSVSRDTETGVPSAIQILEDILVSRDIFDEAKKKKGFVLSPFSFSIVFVADWRWPEEIASRDEVEFELVWVTPGGSKYSAVNDQGGIQRPETINRAHVEIKLEGVPVEDEGVYYFDIVLNGISRFKYPVRLRATGESEEVKGAVKKKPSKQKRKPTAK